MTYIEVLSVIIMLRILAAAGNVTFSYSEYKQAKFIMLNVWCKIHTLINFKTSRRGTINCKIYEKKELQLCYFAKIIVSKVCMLAEHWSFQTTAKPKCVNLFTNFHIIHSMSDFYQLNTIHPVISTCEGFLNSALLIPLLYILSYKD